MFLLNRPPPLQTHVMPKSKSDCNSRDLVRRMDFSNESWFHDIPTDKKMYQCREHFKMKMNQQCSNNMGDILGLGAATCSVFLFFLWYGICQKSDSISPNNKLMLLMLMLTALFQGILLTVTIVMFCTSFFVDFIMVSAVSIFLVLLWPLSVRLRKKHSSPEAGSSGVAQNTQRLPDGDSQILRLYVFGPSGLKDYGSTTLHCKI